MQDMLECWTYADETMTARLQGVLATTGGRDGDILRGCGEARG